MKQSNYYRISLTILTLLFFSAIDHAIGRDTSQLNKNTPKFWRKKMISKWLTSLKAIREVVGWHVSSPKNASFPLGLSRFSARNAVKKSMTIEDLAGLMVCI
jgi:hypothetical protein